MRTHIRKVKKMREQKKAAKDERKTAFGENKCQNKIMIGNEYKTKT